MTQRIPRPDKGYTHVPRRVILADLYIRKPLFVVKPSRQSWVGFVVTLGICVACVLVMLALLK